MCLTFHAYFHVTGKGSLMKTYVNWKSLDHVRGAPGVVKVINPVSPLLPAFSGLMAHLLLNA